MTNVVQKSGADDGVAVTLGQRAVGCLCSVLQLTDALADVIPVALIRVEPEDLADRIISPRHGVRCCGEPNPT